MNSAHDGVKRFQHPLREMTLDGFLEELETSPGKCILEGTVGEAVRSLYIGEMGQDRLLHRQLQEI